MRREKQSWTLMESRHEGEDEVACFTATFRTKRAAIRALRRALRDPCPWADRISLLGPVTATFEKGGETSISQDTKSRRLEISPRRLLGDLRGMPTFKRAKPFVVEPFEVSRD